MMAKELKTTVVMLVMIFTSLAINAQNWTNLFNGKNLDGWEIKQGSAEYKVDGNEIIGYSKLGTESTYLCTKKLYGDFILEVDVKMEVGLNSGIQFRSLSHDNGEVYGYQAEIDASDRKWSGGIFDQSRRGWVYPVTMNEPGERHLKTVLGTLIG